MMFKVLFLVLALWSLETNSLNILFKQKEIIEQMKKYGVYHHNQDRLKDTDRPLYCNAFVHKTNIGQGQDLKFIQRGIGKCVKVPLSSSDGDTPTTCLHNHLCLPSKSKVHDISTLSGIRTTSSAVQCACIDPSVACRRVSNLHTYHVGSFYKTTVDVGRCVGTCSNSKGQKTCKAVSTAAVSVSGPNGAQCVKKITECACSRTCYRVSHKQLFRIRYFDETAKSNRTVHRMIDVGRCSGQCYKKRPSACIYWAIKRTSSGKSRTVCMFRSRREEKTRCLPRVFKSLSMLDSEGKRKVINIVKRCGCQ